MLQISLREMLVIGIITIICGFIIHKIIYKYGSDEIKQNNVFYIHRKNWLFYISLFITGSSPSGIITLSLDRDGTQDSSANFLNAGTVFRINLESDDA